ncbi:MAG TPA: Ig-like domain-containing protein [Phycisphaerales bacterium]|nr:Ig-like domain-containing protein [Phycisphaerales bacterium]
MHFYAGGGLQTEPDGTQSQQVMQRVFNNAGGFTDRLAGRHVYHAAHSDLHFDGWTEYRLRVRPPEQSVGPVLRSSEYTSFCVLDLTHWNPGLPGSPPGGVYGSCGPVLNGLSVGWADIQASGLAGQSIDLTGIPNGTYWLEAVADPRGNLLETNETNNTLRVPVVLTSQPPTGLRVLSSSPSGTALPPVSYVDLTFNQGINGSTFTAADAALVGPGGTIDASAVSPVDGNVTFRVSFPAQTVAGTYAVSIGPNILSTGGQAMDQDGDGTPGEPADVYGGVFVIPGFRGLLHTPLGTVPGPVSNIEITFSRPIDGSTFTLDDLVFGYGSIPINATSVEVIEGNTARVTFPEQSTSGTYTLVVGPAIRDTEGNLMDQDSDGVSGEADDRYSAAFTIRSGTGPIGPNSFGYRAINTPGDALPVLAAGAAGVVMLSFSNADDGFAAVGLGVNQFNFYGAVYTASQLYVSTNGLISAGSGSSAYENGPLLGTPTQAAIAALWDDWISGGAAAPGASVLYRLLDVSGDGVPDWLIVQWTNVRHYPGGTSAPGTATFRAALQLNTGGNAGEIRLFFPDVDVGMGGNSFGGSATAGIKDVATGFTNLLWSHNEAIISNGETVLCTVGPLPCVPSFTQQPAAQLVESGEPATFSILVSGLGPVGYQWLRNGSELVDGGAVSGATTQTLHLVPAALADDGDSFSCVVVNPCGSVTSSSATLTVTPPCPADWNGSGTVTSADITAFLNDWFTDLSGGTTVADFNNSGVTSSADISAFLAAWFQAVAAGGC